MTSGIMATKTKGKWKEKAMKKAVDGVLAGKFSFREADVECGCRRMVD